MSLRKVGFIGLGIMGAGMVKNLLAKGHEVRVWNRSAARVAELGLQAHACATPRQVAEQCDVVVTCVTDPAAVERVVFGADGVLAAARPGLCYVESSTVSVELVQRLALAFEAKGADVLEAPMTGSRLGAQNGTLLFMTGGKRAVHDLLSPVLLAMGSRAIYCGPSGQGAAMKLVGNSIISFMLGGFCESLAVAQKAGLGAELVLEVIRASGFASPYYDFKGKALCAGDYSTHFALDLLVKDQSLMLALAAAHGTPMPGLAAIGTWFRAASEQGHGGEDIVAVFKAVQKAAGLLPAAREPSGTHT